MRRLLVVAGRMLVFGCFVALLPGGCQSPAPAPVADQPAQSAPAKVARAPRVTRKTKTTDPRRADQVVRIRARELQADHHREKGRGAYERKLYARAEEELRRSVEILKPLSKIDDRIEQKLTAVKEDLFRVYCDWAKSQTERAREIRSPLLCDSAVEKYRRAAELFPGRYPGIDDDIRKALSVKQLVTPPKIRLSRER